MNGVAARSNMNCAILSPGLMMIGSAVSFFMITMISPRKSLSMTPPFIVVPFRAILLLSAILIYIPFGKAVDRPVGILVIVNGGMVTGPGLVTSCPIAPGVAVDGMVAWETRRRICTSSENFGNDVGGMKFDFVLDIRDSVE